MTIGDRITALQHRMRIACEQNGRDPDSVELLAVSKTHGAKEVREALRCGLHAFGENRVQELVGKASDLADADVEWHMIGSLQTNKVRELVRIPRLAMLHSLDRAKLADALQHGLGAHDRALDVLLQVNVSGEASKHGLSPHDAADLIAHVLRACPRLSIQGLMAIGPLTGDPTAAFQRAADLRRELRQRFGLPLPVLSMGMTGDLEVAIAQGSTLVRVGTGVFGPRA